jgi:peptidoglycan/LPS O-acetylase OafA/YrhL
MVIVTVAVGWVVLYIQYALTGDLTVQIGFWNLLNSILLTFNGGAINNIEYGINNPAWYICVLIICYAIGYFISFISKRTNTNAMNYVVAMVFIGLGIINYKIELPFANYYSARGYEAFFLGVILFRLYDKVKNTSLITVGAALTIAVITYCMFEHAVMIDDVEAINIFIFNPAILLFFIGINSFFRSKIWQILGGISFEIYIWHAVILVFFTCYWHLTSNASLLTWTGALLFSGVTVLVSVLSYLFVEPKVNAIMEKILL